MSLAIAPVADSKTPANRNPILFCSQEHKPTRHAFVRKANVNDNTGRFLFRELLFACGSCSRERRFGAEDR